MSWILGVIGGIVLFLYGIVPPFQQSYFHRIYAAYGGIFIVMAMFWGWIVGGNAPDVFDIIGAAIALVGAAIILYFQIRVKSEEHLVLSLLFPLL